MAKIKAKKELISPTVKDVLTLLAAGTFLAATIIAPCLPLALKPLLDYKRQKDYQKWHQFNQSRLKQVLKRLKEQKIVEVVGDETIKITEKGKIKILKFNLEDMQLNKKWDGKWRLIIYDVPKHKKKERNYLREILKRLECFQLQKSVYLTPHPCENEIEFLRQLLNIGNDVKILKVASIENEKPYRDYFGI